MAKIGNIYKKPCCVAPFAFGKNGDVIQNDCGCVWLYDVPYWRRPWFPRRVVRKALRNG